MPRANAAPGLPRGLARETDSGPKASPLVHFTAKSGKMRVPRRASRHAAACLPRGLARETRKWHEGPWVSCHFGAKGRLAFALLPRVITAMRDGWIQVYYQPVVMGMSRTLSGVEALARWIDPRARHDCPRKVHPRARGIGQDLRVRPLHRGADLQGLPPCDRRSLPSGAEATRSGRTTSAADSRRWES